MDFLEGLEKIEIQGGYSITTSAQTDLMKVIEQKLLKKQPFRVVTFNPEMMVYAAENKEFKESIISADAITPDGIGIVLLLKKLGLEDVKRQPGIELSWAILVKAIELQSSIAIIGSTDEALTKAIDNITERIGKPNLVMSRSGFFREDEEAIIIDKLTELQPDLLLVAMPFPRQEALLSKLFHKSLKSVGVGVGGSIDVWSGKIHRAPKFMQLIGLEWLWRLLKQPSRLSRLMKTIVPFMKIYFSTIKKPA
ncbi:MAG: WecB/TagA/CpsF family glycosyltransferase [Candidatus Caenarcaniphilales bacterium]|nr:WecB/TagA/CpsF family glycosyltransferase [Candidatus Caenarcaniphilales bacterium]